jgi:acetyl-CoA carboxylase carboxyl transferase subunit beta
MSSENQPGKEEGGGAEWFHRDRGGKVPAQDPKKVESTVTSGLWTKCGGCGDFLRTEELEANLMVCPGCSEHHRISAMPRLLAIVDEDSFCELDTEVTSTDPLNFVDTKPYVERLSAALKKTKRSSAFISGRATLDGRKIQIGSFLFDFMGGSMGSAVGEKITRLFERGLKEQTPVICISASGGARMQEGVLSLMQMARSTAALSRLKMAGLPYISLLVHPTTGGVAASFAMLGHLIIAEPKALIGFAGPRVIEQTIREVLPEGFQRSEFLMEHGMLDQIVDRRELRSRIATLLSLLQD